MRIKLILLVGILAANLGTAASLEPRPADGSLDHFIPLRAPRPAGLLLRAGDRLAICGDSITEQKMYSRIMEDYLTVCAPELKVTVRQYGWSGERAPGFLERMTNDCLRFQPTIATTCYGMNDHEYRPYEERIGLTYCEKSVAIVEAFKDHGVRVILGSPGCVGKMPSWVKSASGTVEDLNLSLCVLRNLGIGIAAEERVGFADVFWPMLTAGVEARAVFRSNYAVAGNDGVHPGWAGHAVMAYAFLKAMGLDGEIGAFTVDLKNHTMNLSKGHELVSAKADSFVVRSFRYPFCPCIENGQGDPSYPACPKDDPTADSSIRSAMRLVPFNKDLNRLMLVVRHAKAASYKVTWGGAEKTFTPRELAEGVNLAEAFPCNPFSGAFAKVDAAVAAKQAFETQQVKSIFHGDAGKADMEGAVARTERERQPLAQAIQTAFAPVTHELRIEAQ